MSEKRIASTPKVFQVTARPIKRHSPSPNASNQSSTILNTSAKRVATAPTTIPKVTLPPTQPTIVTNQGVFQVKLVSDNAQSTSSTPSNLLIQPQSLQKTFNSKTITLMPRSNLQKIAPSAIPSNVQHLIKWPSIEDSPGRNHFIITDTFSNPRNIPRYLVVKTLFLHNSPDKLDLMNTQDATFTRLRSDNTLLQYYIDNSGSLVTNPISENVLDFTRVLQKIPDCEMQSCTVPVECNFLKISTESTKIQKTKSTSMNTNRRNSEKTRTFHIETIEPQATRFVRLHTLPLSEKPGFTTAAAAETKPFPTNLILNSNVQPMTVKNSEKTTISTDFQSVFENQIIGYPKTEKLGNLKTISTGLQTERQLLQSFKEIPWNRNKGVASIGIQTDEPPQRNCSTMTISPIFHNKGVQFSSNVSQPKVETATKDIQCNLLRSQTWRWSESDSETIKSEDSEEELIYAPPVEKNYESKCKQIDEDSYQCTECGLVKKIKHVLIRHIMGHGQKCSLCQFCGRIFSGGILAVKVHERNCKDEDIVNFKITRTPKEQRKCPYCNRISKSYIMHMDHLNVHTKEQPNICSCGARFTHIYSLYVHRRQTGCAHKGCYSPYVDDIEEEYSGKKKQIYMMRIQEKRKSSEVEKKPKKKKNTEPLKRSFQCEICQKLFVSNQYFKRHLRLHRERKFACQQCNRVYPSVVNLRIHVKVAHINKYKCKICKKLISNRKQKDHQKFHEGKFPFKCKDCTSGFFSMMGLRTHMLANHSNQLKIKDPIKYHCPVCGVVFFSDIRQAHAHMITDSHLDSEVVWKERYGITHFRCDRCANTQFDTLAEYCQHSGKAHNFYLYKSLDEILHKFVNKGERDSTSAETDLTEQIIDEFKIENVRIGSEERDDVAVSRLITETGEDSSKKSSSFE